MAKRRMSDWNSFVSARMRALSPADRAEAQMAMKQIAAEWRELNHSTNPSGDDLDNPMPRRRRYTRRRNPSSNSMLKYLLIGGALYFLVIRGRRTA